MMMTNPHSRHYLIIWLWLMALVLVSVAAATILPKGQAVLLIFTVAVVKAVMVALNYMHLKFEKPLIYAIVLVPVAFIVIFLFGLFPDFVDHLTKPTKP
jgi:caa(3)-type oxidase subunit IV